MKAIIIMAILAIFLMPVFAFAEDGNNVLDQLGDTLSGKGNTYAGVECIKDIDCKLPLGIDKVGLKFWADAMVGEIDEGVKRDIRGGARLRLIF